MPITFACENCGKSFTVDDKFAGKKGRCKQCGEVMPIPFATVTWAEARPVDLEISPSRRGTPAPAPARPPSADVFGFDEPPSPKPLPEGIEEIDEFAPVPQRFKPRPSGLYDPPVRRKKSGSGVGAGTIIKMIVGIGLGLAGLGVGGVVLMALVGLSGKGELEAVLQERVRLNEELATLLSGVMDANSAGNASPEANQKLRAIAANLRKMKSLKGLQVDIDALKVKYGDAQIQATQRVLAQFNRIRGIPGARVALNVEAAAIELAEAEQGIPGVSQAPAPPRTAFVPPPVQNPVPPPNFNPGPRPGANPGPQAGPNRKPNKRPNPGPRKGMSRPNSGGPPG